MKPAQRILRVGLAVAIGVIIGCVWIGGASAVPPAPADPSVPGVDIDYSPLPRGSMTTSYAPVVEQAAPSVVNVFSTEIVKNPAADMQQFFNNPFFREFFGGQAPNVPKVLQQRSLGSGVIINSDGHILTNNHVIKGAQEIKVSLADGGSRTFSARVVGADSLTDLAVLKIEAADLPVITFADSDRLQVGDVALAVGNPFGVGKTVTMGIVSALNRGGLGIEAYENFIQTDAAINPGNSGGALIDAEGRLIGINTAILASKSGGNEGIGFAIPSNLALQIAEQLIQKGRVVRGYLGVLAQSLTPALAKQFGVPADTRGALISSVKAASPAARAGLQAGDIVVSVGGQATQDSRDLMMQVEGTAPGTQVELEILRDGKREPYTLTLGELPGAAPAPVTPATAMQPPGQSEALAGLTVADLTPELRKELGVPAQIRGAVITQADPSSAAYAAGLRAGDVIEQIDHRPIQDAQQAVQIGQGLKKNEPALLLVWSKGGSIFVVVSSPGAAD
jgi:serine protease Do